MTSHRSFYKQQKEDSAGSIAQETLSVDMMAPHFCGVEWEERPKARWSTSEREAR